MSRIAMNIPKTMARKAKMRRAGMCSADAAGAAAARALRAGAAEADMAGLWRGLGLRRDARERSGSGSLGLRRAGAGLGRLEPEQGLGARHHAGQRVVGLVRLR